jgi:hypothetical protein
MTSTPDPDELEGPGLPRDPHDYALRRRGLSLGFWVMMAFAVLCVLAGVAIDRLGPKLFPARNPQAPPAQSAAAALANPATDEAAEQAPSASGAPIAPPPVIAGLSTRLDRLESGNDRLREAAAEALAAADLAQAAQTSRPFADQVEALRPLLPQSPALRALAAYAQTGAPSRAQLANALDTIADHIVVAAQEPAKDAGAFAHLTHMLAAVFTVRRVDRLTGDDADAVLARAQAHADDGDLEGAVHALDQLAPGGRDAAAAWRAQALRRIEIDALAATLRADAERNLATTAAPAPATP